MFNNGHKNQNLNKLNTSTASNSNGVDNGNNNKNGNTSPGIQETDAAHQRFREKEELVDIICVSCRAKFLSNNIMTVMEHYGNQVHHNFHSKCLYCNGKVHMYLKGGIEKLYHDCYRSKMNLDK